MLNDAEQYFYIRNAQSDIIGIINSIGKQVVTYTYDTWGKLISITGDKALGEKNPYRYRGYRYDTETGYYYLQSRYYNPEWGRFLNADAIGGSIGELLSHNTFAYCNNNPVNAKDPNGFRPIYTQGEETAAMRKASYKAMTKVAAVTNSRYTNTSVNNGITKKETFNTAKNVVKNAGVGYAGYIAKELAKLSAIAFNRAMERAGEYILVPGSKFAKTAGAGLAIFGVVDTVWSINKNFKDSKSLGEAWGKTIIDISVITLSAVAGAMTSPIGGVVAGTGISLVGDLIKSSIWDE